MKKLLGVIGILALVAALLPAQGFADFRGSYAPLATGGTTGLTTGIEQAAFRPVDVDGLMLFPVDNNLCEEWWVFSSRSLIPNHETVRSIYEHLNAQQSGYFVPLLSDPAAEISYFDPAWSSDGRFLAYIQTNRDGSDQKMFVQEFFVNDDFEAQNGGSYPPGEGAESPVGSPILVVAGPARHPAWQPGTHTLAFDQTDGSNPPNIYTIDVDTDLGTVSNLTRRTFSDPKAEVTPAWAPNGHEIVYSTNKFGPNILEIIDINKSSGAPDYTRPAEINFNSSVSHNNPSYTSDGGTIYYDAPGSEDPNGLTTIWRLDLGTQAKCEITLDATRASGDPDVSTVESTTLDNIHFNYFAYTSQAANLGVAVWRANPINACVQPLKMGVATIPAIMDLNDTDTEVFRTVMNFPPETRDLAGGGYACYFPNGSGVNYRTEASGHGGSFGTPVDPVTHLAKDSIKPRNTTISAVTLLGLAPAGRPDTGSPFPDCYDSLNKGNQDSLRLVCNWNFTRIANRIIALGLVDQIVPMKMTAYSTGTGRKFQGFAYMKLTPSSLPAAGVALLGNSPNPFNPVTKIKFSVSKPGTYTLRLYNVQGALVKTVASGHYDAGIHEATWDGRTTLGGKAASGVYYARITGSTNEGSSGIKLVLAK